MPSGAIAAHVIASLDDKLWLLPAAQAQVAPIGIHGQPRCLAPLACRRRPGAGRAVASATLQPLAAMLHAGLIAGALQRVFDMTLSYCNDRVQFGKSIGKFQAIQDARAVMAELVAAAAHTLHGAIGITEEYDLQLYT